MDSGVDGRSTYERRKERTLPNAQKSCSHYEEETPLPILRTSDVRLRSNAAMPTAMFFADGHLWEQLPRSRTM
jgi:hypothetical protein